MRSNPQNQRNKSITYNHKTGCSNRASFFVAIFTNAIIAFCDYCPLNAILRSIKIPQGAIKMVMPLPKRTEHDLHSCTISEAASDNHHPNPLSVSVGFTLFRKKLRQQGINACGNGRESEWINLFQYERDKTFRRNDLLWRSHFP